MNSHLPVAITDAELSQWADNRADDAGRLARELVTYRKGAVPQDVINLVIAAREFWDIHNDLSEESRALDKALEAFGERVPYENEPNHALTTKKGISE